jgi:DNA/RNA-binding domain of Phe-tRNA-synthetase-like protein
MKISIENAILEKYPKVAIGYLVATVHVRPVDPFVENLKTQLTAFLKEQGLDATQFVTHPSLSIWREIYEGDFHVKAKTYRSSLEALVRRVLTDKPIWNICNIVDLYNCCSVLSLLPMGGYDLDKVSGDILIRYGRPTETFLGLGERKPVPAESHHVVYADQSRVICWLWNHKDAEDTCIEDATRHVLFFIDSFDKEKTRSALQLLAENLKKIDAVPLEEGILDKESPHAEIHNNLN